eukprot:15304923-Heterocapsa_arctica.AAC.1
MNKDNLDQTVRREVQGTNADLLIQRHRQNLLVVPVNTDEWLCVQPMTGDAQGDVCAPQKFIQSVDPIDENANFQNRTLLNDLAL